MVMAINNGEPGGFWRGGIGRQRIPTPIPATPTPVSTGPTAAEVAAAAAAKRAADVARARNEGLRKAELYYRSQGLDPTPYLAMVNQEFDRIQGNLGDSDNVSKVFDDTIASSILKGEQARQQNEYTRMVDSQFSPEKENTDISSSLLDDTINSILEDQRKNAQQYIERGKARGIYNDVGYNAGRSAIDTAYSTGRADLNSLGGSVIDKYRTLADAIGDKAHSAASGYTVGHNFSLDPYVAEYNDVLARARSNAGGDLRAMLGGKNYFDFSKLGQSAGMAQGAVNLRDTDVATALNERRRQNSLSRGLGSQGAF